MVGKSRASGYFKKPLTVAGTEFRLGRQRCSWHSAVQHPRAPFPAFFSPRWLVRVAPERRESSINFSARSGWSSTPSFPLRLFFLPPSPTTGRCARRNLGNPKVGRCRYVGFPSALTHLPTELPSVRPPRSPRTTEVIWPAPMIRNRAKYPAFQPRRTSISTVGNPLHPPALRSGDLSSLGSAA